MKKIILATVCIGVLACGINAVSAAPIERERAHQEFAEKMHNDLAKRLNLNDEQKTQADKLRQESREKMKPLMEQKKEIDKQLENVRKENMAEFEKLLNDEQKEEFEKIKEEHKKDRKHRRSYSNSKFAQKPQPLDSK